MIKFIGNCADRIDWDEIIRQCESCEPEYIGPSHKKGDNIPKLDEVSSIWEKAGYKTIAEGGTVGWGMYLPGKQFDQNCVTKFCEIFGIVSYRTAWISKIDTGYFAPWHWDVNDDEEELSKMPEKVRYHCHISQPSFGHIFIAKDECYYGRNQGDTFIWDDRKYWHAGANCGLVPKYIFNIW